MRYITIEVEPKFPVPVILLTSAILPQDTKVKDFDRFGFQSGYPHCSFRRSWIYTLLQVAPSEFDMLCERGSRSHTNKESIVYECNKAVLTAWSPLGLHHDVGGGGIQQGRPGATPASMLSKSMNHPTVCKFAARRYDVHAESIRILSISRSLPVECVKYDV